MDLNYSEEQTMLNESVTRLVRDDYSFAQRQQRLTADHRDGGALWGTFAELGWLAIPFSEEDGGLGGTAVDVGIVMEGLGRALALEPYAPALLAAQLLAGVAGASDKERLLPAFLEGKRRLALAFIEPGGRYDTAYCATTASAGPSGYLLSGHKSLVLGGQHADDYLVIARTSGEVADETGLSLFRVERDQPGLTVRAYRTNDGLGAVDLTFDNLRLDAQALLGDPDNALPELNRIIDTGIGYQAWEAVGAMAALCDATLDYLKTRKQFGRPLGANQALQHRMVDMFIAQEEARSSALYGTLMLNGEDHRERRRGLSLTKLAVDRCARLVAQEAVQLHGAMGVTDELPVGHYFKRLTAIAATYGDSDWHARRLRRLDIEHSRAHDAASTGS